MAFIHGKNTKVLVDQYDLSAYFKSSDTSMKADQAKTTTFGKLANTYLAGLIDSTAKLSGYFDPAAGASDAVLRAALASALGQTVTIAPPGFALGTFCQLLSARESDYGVKTAIDGVVETDATFQADGPIDSGLALRSLTADTATANGAAVDNTAATTNGGVGHLHVTAVSGTTPSDTVKVQHSVDNSVWVDLITFTAATAVGAQRSEVATGTTVNRYLRETHTITGTTPSFTNVVAFARR